jgi:oxygen-independent coproporphyrinogen-3 oxidase
LEKNMLYFYSPYENLIGELCEVARLFFDDVAIGSTDGQAAADAIEHTILGAGKERFTLRLAEDVRDACDVDVDLGGKDELERRRNRKRAQKNALYALLKRATGKKPLWGSLTGIRPTRLIRERMAQGQTVDEAGEAVARFFDVSPGKIDLLTRIVRAQQEAPSVDPLAYDVYVGVPFCASRCSYCSFASVELAKGAHLRDAYVDAVIEEMRASAPYFAGRPVRALYIGGGTPTALTDAQLARLIECALELYAPIYEFTVEAGRPDTMNAGNLKLLKSLGVTRLSVNPQSMVDETLRRVGRLHTAADIEAAMGLTREIGFDNINMDLIAALPGEGAADMRETLERVAKLAPESLTVHTLAIKRASKMRQAGEGHADAGVASQMVDMARDAALGMGLVPYYLYRQKYMADQLENVGYAKPGKLCVYNIDIMEETQTIAAFGAGAISKFVFDADLRIERAPNVKDVLGYIERVGEMAERKGRLAGVWNTKV